jgi:LysM repeat protein
MPRSRTLTIYALLFAFALGAGILVANFFGSTDVLPSGYSASPVATTVSTEVVSTPTTVTPTVVVSPSPEPEAALSPTESPTLLATEAPSAQPTAEPTAEPPTATAEQPTVVPEATMIEYTVQKGDTLKSIAEAHGVTIRDILALNQIENPDSLNVGTVLRIPKS